MTVGKSPYGVLIAASGTPNAGTAYISGNGIDVLTPGSTTPQKIGGTAAGAAGIIEANNDPSGTTTGLSGFEHP